MFLALPMEKKGGRKKEWAQKTGTRPNARCGKGKDARRTDRGLSSGMGTQSDVRRSEKGGGKYFCERYEQEKRFGGREES